MTDRAAQHAGAIAAIEGIVAAGGDADDVLRDVIAALHEHVPDYTWVALRFSEGGDLVLGPAAGEEREAPGNGSGKTTHGAPPVVIASSFKPQRKSVSLMSGVQCLRL